MRPGLFSLILLGFALPVALFATAPVQAAETRKTTLPAVNEIKPLQEWQRQTGMELDYIGSRHGLDAWIATGAGTMELIYTTADKQAMLLQGNLIDSNRQNVTAALQSQFVDANPQRAENMLRNVDPAAGGPQAAAQQTAAAPPSPETPPAAAPATPLTKSEKLWQSLGQAHSVTFGAPTAPVLYMLVDMKCDHCRTMWLELAPIVNSGQLQVKLVPVAILGRPSEKAAASLLSQSDPAKAWADHVAGHDPTTMTQAGVTAFVQNQKIAENYKLVSTPTLIYRDATRQAVKIVLGRPKDLPGFWRDIGAAPAQAPATTPAAAAQ